MQYSAELAFINRITVSSRAKKRKKITHFEKYNITLITLFCKRLLKLEQISNMGAPPNAKKYALISFDQRTNRPLQCNISQKKKKGLGFVFSMQNRKALLKSI